MFFLNFTLGEFVVLFATLAGVITALYLLDRSKSKKIVSTLRFWSSDSVSARQKSRKRMQEPWSFLLQIVSILLLLSAIGQLQWGSRELASRNHVLLVDTSAWSSESITGTTLIDEEKRMALRYLARLPNEDRVLVAGVDAATTPATLFTSDHGELSKALGGLRPSYSALDMGRALSFAQRAETLAGSAKGEIVYIGPGLIQRADNISTGLRNLRTILVRPNEENCGIRNIGLRRDDRNPDFWRAAVTIENYGKRPHAVQLRSEFSGRVVASRFLTLGAHEETMVEYGFTQASGGRLTTSLEPGDALSADDHATLIVPGNNRTRLAVFTDRPDVLKPLAQSDGNVDAQFFTPGQYHAHLAADVLLFDRMSPAEEPRIPALWIAPPRDSSPMPVKEVTNNDVINAWNTTTGLDAGLRRANLQVKAADVFEASGKGDITIASTERGPVMVAHQGDGAHPKFVVLGFDPLQGELRFQTAAPVMFANFLRWLCPATRAVSLVSAGLAGEISVHLSSGESVLSVSDERGTRLPFEVHDGFLEFFANRGPQMRIEFSGGGIIISPVLANVAEHRWTPPGNSTIGLPPSRVALPVALDLWEWLALAGGLGLLADWLLFGRKRRPEIRRAYAQGQPQKDRESELIHK